MGTRKQSTQKQTKYRRGMRRALARMPFLKSDGNYLSRDEVHDRKTLRETK